MQKQPNQETLLDLIKLGDTERLGDFFYTSAAKAKGIVKVRPADIDWEDRGFKRDVLLPAEADPSDIDEAMRWCVLADDIPECEAGTSAIMYLDRETGDMMIAALSGPAHDHDVAIRMVARDLKAEQTAAPAKKVLREAGEVTPKAAPDRQTIFTAADLMRREFEPIRYVWPGYVAEGCTILAGASKLGKSWLVLQGALAVARGSAFLGGQCEQADVLYLALEDNPRRLKDRLYKQNPAMGLLGQTLPASLHFATEWPRADQGGLQKITDWLVEHPDTKLVIIDVLKMFRANRKGNKNPYDLDYEDINPLSKIATEFGVAVVVVHHTNKGALSSDPFDRVNGTGGISGAADTTLIMARNDDGLVELYGRGREIEEIETAITFDKATCTWSVRGNAHDVHMSDTAARILRAMQEMDEPAGPTDIAAAAGVKPGDAKQHLPRMAKDGKVEKEGRGKWKLAGKVTPSIDPHNFHNQRNFQPEPSNDNTPPPETKVTKVTKVMGGECRHNFDGDNAYAAAKDGDTGDPSPRGPDPDDDFDPAKLTFLQRDAA